MDSLQEQILGFNWALEPFAQVCLIKEVDYPNAIALCFILIGGADAAAGGSDATTTPLLLNRLIEQAVIGHGYVGSGCHLQTTGINAIAGEHLQLTEQHLGINNSAGTDQTHGVWVEDSRGNEVQLEHLAIHNNRVPGIYPPW